MYAQKRAYPIRWRIPWINKTMAKIPWMIRTGNCMFFLSWWITQREWYAPFLVLLACSIVQFFISIFVRCTTLEKNLCNFHLYFYHVGGASFKCVWLGRVVASHKLMTLTPPITHHTRGFWGFFLVWGLSRLTMAIFNFGFARLDIFDFSFSWPEFGVPYSKFLQRLELD